MTTLYFDSNRPGGLGPFTTDGANNGNDIYAAFLLFDDTFLWPHLVRSLSSEFADRHPTIRSDGLEVFFHSDRPGGQGLMDLWVSRRAKTWHEWGEPVNVSSLNTVVNDAGPALSFDGRTLYFQSAVPEANFDLFAATREFRECRPPCVCDHCDVHEACRK